MTGERVFKDLNWTPEDRARHEAVRARFRSERPNLEQLIASGEYFGPIPHGAYLAWRVAMHELKLQREAKGLTLAEIAAKSGIDESRLDHMENGRGEWPSVESLFRYASALGKELTFSLRDLSANGA